MGYDLHIERPNRDISSDERSSAVSQTHGVRITTNDAVGFNPTTGEEIRVRCAPGDTEVLVKTGGLLGLGQNQNWHRAFRFPHGRATFRATESVESPKDSIHLAAARLASRLGASIVGDEGEIYDW